MAAKKIKGLGTKVYSANQLDQIGKPDYTGVAQAMRKTGYQGIKIVKK